MDPFPVLVKATMSMFNCFILVFGVLAVTFGILDKMEVGSVTFLVPPDYEAVLLFTSLSIIIGIGAVFISILGCLGALLEKPYLIITFAIALCGLILVQVTVCATFLIMVGDTDTLEQKIRDMVFKNSVDSLGIDPMNGSEKRMDTIHHALRCCGWNPNKMFYPKFPMTCRDPSYKLNYTQTCQKALSDKLTNSTKKLSSILLVLAAIEMLCILAAAHMAQLYLHECSD